MNHRARDAGAATALADVKRLELDIPVVLLVDAQDETSALRGFDGSVECLVKTPPGRTHRLPLRLAGICTRFERRGDSRPCAGAEVLLDARGSAARLRGARVARRRHSGRPRMVTAISHFGASSPARSCAKRFRP